MKSKKTIIKKIEVLCYKYEYTCPHCKTIFQRHSEDFKEIVVINCSWCKNSIKFIRQQDETLKEI